MLRADKPSDDAIEYLGCFHLGFRRFLTVRCAPDETGCREAYVQTSYSNWLDAPAPRNTTSGQKTELPLAIIRIHLHDTHDDRGRPAISIHRRGCQRRSCLQLCFHAAIMSSTTRPPCWSP